MVGRLAGWSGAHGGGTRPLNLPIIILLVPSGLPQGVDASMKNTVLTRLLIGGVAVVCFVLAGLIGWLIGVEFYGTRYQGPSPQATGAEPVLGKAPQYQHLVNQLGHSVDSSQFDGKVQVVTFLFPYCTTYCPLIAAHLVGFENLLQQAGLQNKVQLVAFDVDPGDTGPKQMRAFLKEFGWNPQNLHWQYLTGKPKTIRHVVTDGFHIAYRKVSNKQEAQERGPQQTPQPVVVNPLANKVKPGYDVTHNDGLVIVDPQGRIRKVYDQADVVSNQSLLEAVKPLLSQSTRG